MKKVWKLIEGTMYFKRIDNFGYEVSVDKCEFCMLKLKYLVQIIDAKGQGSDPQRSSAIRNMLTPTNIAELQAFLGLANYYQVYRNNMHELRVPLNELLKKKEKKWNWTEKCQEAFQRKDVLTSEQFVTRFDPSKSKIKWATVVEDDSKAPFLIATTPMCRGRPYSIPWIDLLPLIHT